MTYLNPSVRFLLPFLGILSSALFLKANSKIDTLSFADKFESYRSAAVDFASENKLDSCLVLLNKAHQIAIHNNADSLLAKYSYNKGYSFDINGKLDSALIHYENARSRYADLGIIDEVAQSMNAKGVAVHYTGDNERALELYLEALSYQEENGLLTPMAKTINNIGVIYRMTSKNEEAITMYRKALAINRILKDTSGMADQFNNLGVAYTYLKDLDNALLNLDSCLMFYTLADYEFGKIIAHNSYGDAYYEINKDLDNARKHLMIANDMLQGTSEQYALGKNSIFLGKLELESKKYKDAISYLLAGLTVIESTDRKELIAENYYYLSQAYAASNQNKEAFHYLNLNQELNEELTKEEKLNALEEMQAKYESKEKEKQIQLQELQIDKNQKERRNLFAILGLLAAGLISSTWFVFNKIKTNKLLDHQKSIIQKALDEREILLKEIHHRVKNNLQVVSSLLTLQGKYSQDPLITDAIRQGSDRVKSMSLIHQNLYQKENLTGVKVQTYFNKLFESLFYSYNINDTQVSLDLDIEDIQLDVDSIVPIGLIVNELVSNALKHAFPEGQKGKVSVSLKEQENQLVLTVQDNGIGIHDSSKFKTKNSLGFELIDVFAKKIKADMDIQTVEGTTVELRISKYKKTA